MSSRAKLVKPEKLGGRPHEECQPGVEVCREPGQSGGLAGTIAGLAGSGAGIPQGGGLGGYIRYQIWVFRVFRV